MSIKVLQLAGRPVTALATTPARAAGRATLGPTGGCRTVVVGVATPRLVESPRKCLLKPENEVPLSEALWSLLETVVERNTDFYEP